MGFFTLEHATYNWPWAKQSSSKFIPTNSRVYPWLLLMVMENANFTGNCNRLNDNGTSDGDDDWLGISICPLNHKYEKYLDYFWAFLLHGQTGADIVSLIPKLNSTNFFVSLCVQTYFLYLFTNMISWILNRSRLFLLIFE